MTASVVPDIDAGTTPLAAALVYAGVGWPVFPCRPGSKVPATVHGFKDATTDPSVITGWWSRTPGANVAIPTGLCTVDVLDVDVKGATDGTVTFERLKLAGLLGGALAIVCTPSGGFHVYYPGTNQGNGSIARRGIDFRSAGGYVLTPPSTIDGRSYVWSDRRERADGCMLDWQAVQRLLVPPRPRAPELRGQAHKGSVDSLARWVARQPEGNRNHALYWAACRAVQYGQCDLNPLVDAAVAAGLGEQEARRTVESALRRLGGVA